MDSSEASKLIEAALEEALKMTFEDQEVGDLLDHWIVVAHVANIDPEKGDGYPMFLSNGHLPTHIARGLLHTGLKMLNENNED